MKDNVLYPHGTGRGDTARRSIWGWQLRVDPRCAEPLSQGGGGWEEALQGPRVSVVPPRLCSVPKAVQCPQGCTVSPDNEASPTWRSSQQHP